MQLADFLKGFNKTQKSWKNKVEAWRQQAIKTETTPDSPWLNKAGKVEECLVERDAASARLHEPVSALLQITEAWEEEKDKAAGILTKVKKRYEQARTRVAGPRAADESELWERIITHSEEVEATDLDL